MTSLKTTIRILQTFNYHDVGTLSRGKTLPRDLTSPQKTVRNNTRMTEMKQGLTHRTRLSKLITSFYRSTQDCGLRLETYQRLGLVSTKIIASCMNDESVVDLGAASRPVQISGKSRF